jgi:hypothetical protein
MSSFVMDLPFSRFGVHVTSCILRAFDSEADRIQDCGHMKTRFVRCMLGATLLAAVTVAEAAREKPSLEPFAGSYTGTAASTTSAGALFSPSTLTFTGRQNSLRGTFLYTGILNQAGTAQTVVQTLDVSRRGVCTGRVTVGGIDASPAGRVSLRGTKLATTITYSLPDGTVITLDGGVKFRGKRAKWSATVSSSDAGYAGTLLVKGKR